MDSKIYEAIQIGIQKALNEVKFSKNPKDPNFIGYADRKILGLTDDDFEETPAKQPEKKIISNGKGRPATKPKLSNLYPAKVVENKKVEQYIRAYVNGEFRKYPNKVYYNDNIEDMNKLRNIYITAIYKFMQNNKDENFDWQSGDEYFTKLYNLADLEEFIKDIRNNYNTLCASPFFPRKNIQLNEPIKLKSKRGRKPKTELTDEQKRLVDEYIAKYGKGTPLEEISEETIKDIRQYTLYRNGIGYVVCRPLESGNSDPNAPALVYKIDGKYSVDTCNAIRYTYFYQCKYEYGCSVDYMYVSPILVDKYLRKEKR